MATSGSLFRDALPVSMAGLRAATARVEEQSRQDTDGSRLAQAVIETLWWQKSLEDLWEEESGEAYYRLRDSSDGGTTVGGLAYARNAGGHRVGRTYDQVVYRAASTVESVVLASFEPGSEQDGTRTPRWPALLDLPSPPMEDPFGRAAMYSDQVASRPLLEPLRAALRFFEGLLTG